MQGQEMTQQAALVLTEWVHTLARELYTETGEVSAQRIAAAMTRCCPEGAFSKEMIADIASAVEAVSRLCSDVPIGNGREAVQRLESALPEGLNECQKEGYFSLLLSGLSEEGNVLLHGMETIDGRELRWRLGRLLEETAERILTDMAELARSGAAGLEPVAPEPMEGGLRNQGIPILAAAVFCTEAEGLLGRTWHWPTLVGISLAAGGMFVAIKLQWERKDDRGGLPEFQMLLESWYGAILLALTAFCHQIFITGGGELDVMQELLVQREEWPVVLGWQMYGLLGHVSGYGAPGGQADPVLFQLADGLCAYQIYLESRKNPKEYGKTHAAMEKQAAGQAFWMEEQAVVKQRMRN